MPYLDTRPVLDSPSDPSTKPCPTNWKSNSGITAVGRRWHPPTHVEDPAINTTIPDIFPISIQALHERNPSRYHYEDPHQSSHSNDPHDNTQNVPIMTSRPGQFERPPNVRSISKPWNTPIALQKPSPHRSLSQQFASSSPTRRTTDDGIVDLTLDGPEGVGGRTIPRSRLNLEIGKNLSKEDLVESPGPTTDLASTWKPSLPPRGRPRLHSDFLSVRNGSPQNAQDGGPTETAIKPMPLPPRPGQHAPPFAAAKMRQAPSNAVKKDVRPKPYTLEVPSLAPSFPPNGFADFNPWTGNHPEDQFSESVIRQGYFDKAQMTQNETGSAKASIFPALKHKSGLQTLSSLFTSIMAQRRSHGQITMASTFKPPPRVTVTDTKREIWLKDLANPTISLRRLSRSIPHGIRGKVLLDQSLSKNIPIERAVWLAKCVGANELRSFRRKGVSGTMAMGGEAKWIRDFTVCVEQFVEGIIGTCGEKDFKTKINYAIRLATHFHAEYLLDRDHYLDWLVSSLENTPEAKLPVWLLITQIYWKDLLQHRKYGRRLATALLNHLAEASSLLDRDILAPLHDRLSQLLKGAIMSSQDSFISPKVWIKHEELIQSVYATHDERFRTVLAHLSRRNRNLNKSGAQSELSSRRRLIKLLDSAISIPFSSDLPQQCWDLDSDKEMLGNSILGWAISSRRPGVEKIFVAVRILRYWSKWDLNVTDIILRFIEPGMDESKCSATAFYHLVSELARSEHFSTARYLQWLMARGGIYDSSDIAEGGPCATRLVTQLPTHNLSERICELRATLLSRVNFRIEDEDDYTRACMIAISRELPGMQRDEDFDLEDCTVSGSAEDLISGANQTTISEIGMWLRQKVKVQMDQAVQAPTEWGDLPVKREPSLLTLSDFNAVKRCLLLTKDYSMLADVLKLVSGSSNAEILASCADSLNLYLNVFAAIGALKSVFDLLMDRIKTFTEDLEAAPRVLLVSLSDLASRLPEQHLVAQRLGQELARSDRKTAADTCSPVSDHMALMQTAEADFSDEIEKILASGNSMDRGTLERLFQRIILRLEESFDKTPEQQRSCSLLLTRLKTFDAESFNVLMLAWVARFTQLASRPSLIQILGPLISFGCIALSDIISILISTTGKGSLSLEALTLVLAIPNVPEAMSVGEVCRLLIKQSHLQRDHPREVLFIIRQAMESASAEHLTDNQDLLELLQRLVLVDPDMVIKELISPLLQKSEPAALGLLISVVDRLLLCDQPKVPISAETILGLADDLSLPFCQIKLATMFTSSDSFMSGTEETTSQRLEAFDIAIESAVSAGRTSWSSIVPLLDASIAKHLRQRAATQFLTSIPSLKSIVQNDADIQQGLGHAKNLLHIVDATAYSVADQPASSICSPGSEMPSALHNIWLTLANSQVRPATKDIIISSWLPLVLSFTSMHRYAFDNTKLGNENRGKTIITLAAIVLELESREIRTEKLDSLSEQIYDLALYLVDSLPDEVRLQCIRSLRDTNSVPRVRYLFSIFINPSDWLVLMQREKLVTGPPSHTSATSSEGMKVSEKDRLTPFPLRRWEMLGEPTPNVGENDTSLSLTLFAARKG